MRARRFAEAATSIKGIGLVTATILIAQMPELGALDPKARLRSRD